MPDCDLCNYKCKENWEIKRHKRNKHNIDVNWIYCDLCDYKAKNNSHLKSHKSNKHNIGIKWYFCDHDGCDHKCKVKKNLKQHKSNKHNIGVIWYTCDKCEYSSKTKGTLKDHKANMHNIGVKWFYCEKCDHKCKTNSLLTVHKRQKHDINVTWVYCDQFNCIHRTKTSSSLKKHKQDMHDIDVIWFACEHKGCDSKFKSNSHLKRHKQNKHNIDVKWHYCDKAGCGDKFKSNAHLKRHKSQVHDIGDKNCEFCLRNVYSLTGYKDKIGNHKICRKCYNKATGKESRAETAMSDYLNKHIGKEFLLGTDTTIKGEACQRYRPDKIYGTPGKVIHIECDEHEHKRKGGNYSCDEKRISDIYDEFPGNDHIVIRWNPDNYKVPEGKTKVKTRKARLELLLKCFKVTQTYKFDTKIAIIYMYYSKDNSRISENIKHYFVYDEKDLEQFT